MSFRNLLVVGACALAAAVACGGEDESGGDDDGGATADTCPNDLTWEKSAQPFLENYCFTCHSESTKDSGDGHAFVTERQIRAHGHDVYEQVESGEMPKSGPRPSDD